MSTKQLRNVSIICNGSRGDYQPYLALGVQLQDAGYNVRILTNIAFEKYSSEFNVTHVTIDDQDAEKTMKQNPEVVQAMTTGNTKEAFQSRTKRMKLIAPSICKAFVKEITDNRPDLLIVGTLVVYFGFFAEMVLHIPTISVKLQSTVCTPTRAPLGFSSFPDGSHLFKILDILVENYDAMSVYDDEMETLGYRRMKSIFSKDSFKKYFKQILDGRSDKLVIICQSPLFKDILAPGSDDNLAFVGSCILDEEQQKGSETFFGGDDNEKRFEAFLMEDPERKPVYCGWGSMVSKSPEYMVQFAVKSLQISGERGVVLGGFAGLSLDLLKTHVSDDNKDLVEYAEKNVLFLDKASHESIFPRMKCIIHHGGAGTFNAALRSGVPTIITPIFTDQFDHSYVVNELYNGFGFSKQLLNITCEELGEAIKSVVNDPDKYNKAQEIQSKVLQEDGKKTTVKLIQKYWESLK